MELDLMIPQQTAEQWNISDGRIQELCAKGRINVLRGLVEAGSFLKVRPNPLRNALKLQEIKEIA